MKFITIPKTCINEGYTRDSSRTFNLRYIDEIYGIGNGDDYFDIVILKTNGNKIYFEYDCETSRDEVLEELIQKIHEKTDYNG